MLRPLAEGKTYQEIALETGLSRSTIRTHLHNVYIKLGVVDRAQAVLTAVRRGLIEDPYASGSASGDLSLWESTLESEVVNRAPPAARHQRAKERRPIADLVVAEGGGPRPFLEPAESRLTDDGGPPPRKEGALADVLIAMNLKGLTGTEDELAETYAEAMGADGFDRYGKLIKLAAVAMLAAVRVRVLSE